MFNTKKNKNPHKKSKEYKYHMAWTSRHKTK
jgi:hypothetical protein